LASASLRLKRARNTDSSLGLGLKFCICPLSGSLRGEWWWHSDPINLQCPFRKADLARFGPVFLRSGSDFGLFSTNFQLILLPLSTLSQKVTFSEIPKNSDFRPNSDRFGNSAVSGPISELFQPFFHVSDRRCQNCHNC